MQWFQRISHLNGHKSQGRRKFVNGMTDGLTENRTPISHLAKAGATIKIKQSTAPPIYNLNLNKYFSNSLNPKLDHFPNLFIHHIEPIVKERHEKKLRFCLMLWRREKNTERRKVNGKAMIRN